MSRSDIARILSPLGLFGIHVIYLAVWSEDPFLKKWIDGSFTFFLALVMCNVIRARIVASADSDRSGDHDGLPPDSNSPPDETPPGN